MPFSHNRRLSDAFKTIAYTRTLNPKGDASEEEMFQEEVKFIIDFCDGRRFFICGKLGLLRLGWKKRKSEMWFVFYLEARFHMFCDPCKMETLFLLVNTLSTV
jgi:hypothetical protein